MPGGQAKSLPVIPEALVTSCLECFHDKTGHLGLEKTIGLVKERVWWPGYTRDVDTWITRCSTCAQKKKPAIRPKAKIQSIPVGRPVEMWAMDFVGPLPVSTSGNRYIYIYIGDV